MRLLLILLAIVFLLQPASAYYIPPEHMDEAKTMHGIVEWYDFAMKYNSEPWANDVLRQMAINNTNNGRITSLFFEIEKYRGKNGTL